MRNQAEDKAQQKEEESQNKADKIEEEFQNKTYPKEENIEESDKKELIIKSEFGEFRY